MPGGGLVSKTQHRTSMQQNAMVIPKEFVSKIKDVSAPCGRQPVFSPASTRMPIFQDNPLIEYKLGNSLGQWYDYSRASILVKLQLNVAPATVFTYLRPCNLIANMIERFELTDGNTEVEDYKNYPEKYTLDYFLDIEKNAQAIQGHSFYGEGSQVERNSRHVTAGVAGGIYEYKLPLTSDPLSVSHAFPNFEPFAKSNDQMMFKWYIANASKWIETDAPAGSFSWTILQWEIHYELLDVDNIEKYVKLVQDRASPAYGTLKFSWLYDDIQIRPLDTTNTQTILIDQKRSSIQGILVTVRKSADVNNALVNDKYETWFGPKHITAGPIPTFPLIDYQWRMDSKTWPERPIKTVGPHALESFVWFNRWLGHETGNGHLKETHNIGGEQYANDKFVMLLDARVWPQLHSEVYNNINTLKTNTNLELHLNFGTSNPMPGLQLVIHTIHDKDWHFGFPGGGKTIW